MKKQWWHDKVAYQIYPKSFKDTNGDGIGDLRGIINKLDYLKDLGIDIIWLSPVYCSPFVDQGYDISDYYNIDPRFGTMDDMDELLAEAKKRNMYIVMDLVVNHCSDQHEWFQKALKDPDGEYGQYFYIREGKGDQPPCNWRSYFGGSAWERIPGTNKYYLHLFAKEQPDLNWENEKVRQEIYKMVNWWLDKGLAGFRIDAIINIKKDLRFEDFPPDRDDGLCSPSKMLECADGIGTFLKELRDNTFRKYDAFTVAELFDYKEEELRNYIGEDGYFSTIFDFSTHLIGASEKGWFDRKPVTPNEYRDVIFRSKLKTENIGFLANIIENHDEPRGVSFYIPEGECNDKSKKMLATIHIMLKGIPFIYQGQEIGMTNNEFESIDEIDDIGTKNEYQVALKAGYSPKEALKIISKYSRDNARTPFHWDDSENAGFTTGKPWLVVNKNYKEINVKSQINDENSLLSYYKKLIRLRKDEEYKDAIVHGKFNPIYTEYDNVLAFYRKGESKTVLIIANYQNKEVTLPFSHQNSKVLINNYNNFKVDNGMIMLEPYQTLVLDV
ncbi:MAG: oligo,6-glucosidase [Epulopiscium sp.]|uniref:Glucohydrolase n=1 Tax=Defluviitalea raffinosedens TaxID=1450156 RepID=A0A7C8HCX7_9FIRM|nr:alpha-glucosidase [Defluviitalea raffinosedens]KAE9628424.1 glucohydrolase [Defluviitalea raffinosedens]MDK2788223.1 oligo,6-glucosidase [Candidatus Epulonipiscium sp.]HHW66161.1 alpha-glucosidase [Candidatus Epulonipiscium sp.]